MTIAIHQLDEHDPRQVGPYRLLAKLGAGGMGHVYLGTGPTGIAAVKIVHPWLAHDDEFRARFAREVATSRRVTGRWTAAVIDADPDGPTPWLATEYVHGVSLDRALRTAGPLPPASVHVLAVDMAHALAEIHAAGLVHRDVKPGNVILTADRPYLIDFGISRALDGTRLTSTGAVVGTPAFMSPEQAEGQELRTASDVFSLGALLTCAASGTGPFGDGSPLALLRRIRTAEPDLGVLAAPVRELVAECLQRDPAARPSASALAERLEPIPAIPRHGWLPPVMTALIPQVPTDTAPGPAPATVGQAVPSAGSQPSAEAPTVVDPPSRSRPISRRGLLLGAGGAAVVAAGAGIGLSVRSEASNGATSDGAAARLAWSAQLGGQISGLAPGDGFVCAGSRAAELHRLDLATGQHQWSYTLRSPAGPPVMAGGAVVVSDSDYTYAVDAARGTLLWESQYTTLDGAAEGVVITHTLATGTRDLILVAQDQATGAPLWRLPTADRPLLQYPIAIGGGLLHVAAGTTLTTVDLHTGQVRWQREMTSEAIAAGRIGDVVYVVSRGSATAALVTAFDALTGTPRWERTTRYGMVFPPVVDQGRLISASVECWDGATGEPLWTRQDEFGDAEPGWDLAQTPLAAAGGVVYIGGEELVYDADGQLMTDAAGNNQTIFHLFAFAGDTGRTRWFLPIEGAHDLGAPLVAVPGTVVLGTLDGTVHAVTEDRS